MLALAALVPLHIALAALVPLYVVLAALVPLFVALTNRKKANERSNLITFLVAAESDRKILNY